MSCDRIDKTYKDQERKELKLKNGLCSHEFQPLFVGGDYQGVLYASQEGEKDPHIATQWLPEEVRKIRDFLNEVIEKYES